MNTQGATIFEPSVEWVNEDGCDTLLLYLPGFVKEQLRVQLRSRTLVISGQRKLQDATWTRFEKEFQVSEHCDTKKISAKFEGSILHIRQPILITPVAKQDDIKASNPTPTPENSKVNQADSMAQSNGNNGLGKNVPEKDSVENSGISKGNINEELKDSKKKIATRLKPSRNDLFKVLALIVGFVVGVYCTKSFQSWIA